MFRRRKGSDAAVAETFTTPSITEGAAEYVGACLEPRFTALPEPRSWREPSIRRAVDALNANQYIEAAVESKRVTRKFPDLHLGYVWLSEALTATGQIDRARIVLRQGLQKARSTHSICRSLGETELRAGNLEGAAYWWAQGLHARERLQPDDIETESYLYLSAVANSLTGLGDIAMALQRRADASRGGMVRLDPSESARLRVLIMDMPPASKEALAEVLRGVSERYLQSQIEAARERDERQTQESRAFYLREHQRKLDRKKRRKTGERPPAS
ncbi:MAG: hypothetical protein WD770_09935 [Actinomycetota bacterium]